MARHRFRKIRRYSPRNRYRRFRRGTAPISLLTALPVVHKAFLEPIMGDGARWGAAKMYQSSGGNIQDTVMEGAEILVENFTGFGIKGPEAGKFFPDLLLKTYGEIVIGAIGSKIATKLGANKSMRKIPMLGKYVKL